MRGTPATIRGTHPTIHSLDIQRGSSHSLDAPTPLLILALVCPVSLGPHGVGLRGVLDCGRTNIQLRRYGFAWIAGEPSDMYRIGVCHQRARATLSASR